MRDDCKPRVGQHHEANDIGAGADNLVYGSRPGHPDRPAENGVAPTTVIETFDVCAGTKIPATVVMV